MCVRHVHLVGSVPMADAGAVFETASAVLGPFLRRIPDGETGERLDWVTWLELRVKNSVKMRRARSSAA